jgi:hypothetical protein
MGNPAFLKFGRNYAGTRDRYVYLYSPDTESAYEGSDHLLLARVPKHRLRDRTAYEFFSGTSVHPRWTADLAARKPVFEHSLGSCTARTSAITPVWTGT